MVFGIGVSIGLLLAIFTHRSKEPKAYWVVKKKRRDSVLIVSLTEIYLNDLGVFVPGLYSGCYLD